MCCVLCGLQAVTQVSMGDFRVCMLHHQGVGVTDVDGLLKLLTAASGQQ